MPTAAPEFFRGARVRLKGYGESGSFAGEVASGDAPYNNKYNGLVGTVGAIYGGKFYRVFLENDPDDPEGLMGILCYAHELEIVND